MSPEKKLLKQRGLQCDSFQRFNADAFDPSKHRRPRTTLRSTADVSRKPRPVLAWKAVMLDMVTVVEERHVVEETIVTCGASCVLKVAMQKAQAKTEGVTGEIREQEKPGCLVQQETP